VGASLNPAFLQFVNGMKISWTFSEEADPHWSEVLYDPHWSEVLYDPHWSEVL
jgi:hypothetical protein